MDVPRRARLLQFLHAYDLSDDSSPQHFSFVVCHRQAPFVEYYDPPFTPLHFTSLHFTSLHFTSLHFTSLHSTSLPVQLRPTNLAGYTQNRTIRAQANHDLYARLARQDRIDISYQGYKRTTPADDAFFFSSAGLTTAWQSMKQGSASS